MNTFDTSPDIIVIGGGSGGYTAAIHAAQQGAVVLLIEKDKLGGTCLHTGCIPSKILLHVAEEYTTLASLESFGIQIQNKGLNIRATIEKKNQILQKLTDSIEYLLKSANVHIVQGMAKVDGMHIVSVSKPDGTIETYTTKSIIIASGSHPASLPVEGYNSTRVLTSDTCWNMDSVPSRLLCIGGGSIGTEIACLFQALGTQVSIIEMQSSILPAMDKDIQQSISQLFKKRGIQIFPETKVELLQENTNSITTTIRQERSSDNIVSDYVISATGRLANTEGLEYLFRSGIAKENGRIKVNSRMETSLPDIYAIGDCIHGAGLAYIAAMEGETAAKNCTGASASMDYTAIPSVLFTFPQVASVGLTEQEAYYKFGGNLHCTKLPFSILGIAHASMQQDGFIKLLTVGDYHEIAGAHIVGKDAIAMIQECALAMQNELTLDEIIHTIHPHPTFNEIIREAALSTVQQSIYTPYARF